jgi:tRNA(His) 5'-end guanylyltransferase
MGNLGDRMKEYERACAVTLMKRTPVLIRVDGKAFHTYTKGCDRPFDQGVVEAMWETAKALCNEIQGAQLAYVQSDEISILVHNYKTRESGSWFDNKLQKMASVSAGIASGVMTMESDRIFSSREGGIYVPEKRRACFDSRVWTIPPFEVCNYFIWRQQDWTRNSVQMLARSLYSHKQLHNKDNSSLQEMCFQKGKNWNDLPTYLKRGACIVKNTYTVVTEDDQMATRSRWEVDTEIPIFTQDRYYIDQYLEVDEC